MTEYIHGHQSTVGFGTQTAAIGTGVAATKFQTNAEITIAVDKPNQQVTTGNRGIRGRSKSIEDRYKITGQIKGALYPDEYFQGQAWADFMGGNNTVTGSAGVGFTHVLSEPATITSFPSYGKTIEAKMGGTDNTLLFDFIGCFLKMITLEIPEQGEIIMTADYVGKTFATGGTLTSATFTSKNQFVSSMGKLEISTTISSVAEITDWKTIRAILDNGAEMIEGGNSQTPVGRAYPSDGPKDTVEFTMDRKDSLTLPNYFLLKTDVAIRLTITHTQLAGTASGFYSLIIEWPRCLPKSESPKISGPGLQRATYTYEPYYHVDLGYTHKAYLVNSESGTYTVN